MTTKPTGYPATSAWPPPPAPALDARGLPAHWILRPDLEVTPRDTVAALAQPEATRPLLLDCRRDDEVAFARLPNSLHIPMDQIERRADELDELRGREHPVIVYCHHGVRSLRVALTLRALGFPHARSMAGGIDVWSADIDPSVPRY